MSSNKLQFRLQEEYAEALKELAKELNTSVSTLTRHGVFILLAGADKLPDLDWHNRERAGRILSRLHKVLPVAINWPEHIPKEKRDDVVTGYG